MNLIAPVKIELHPAARHELHEAGRYFKAIEPGLKTDLGRETRSTFHQILANPYLFRIRSNGFRRANLDRFPYYLPFLIKDETVYILAFAHHSRRPDYWIHRTSL